MIAARPRWRVAPTNPVVVDMTVFTLIVLSMGIEVVVLRHSLSSQLPQTDRRLWFLLVGAIALSTLPRRLVPFGAFLVLATATFALIRFVGDYWQPATGQWCMYLAIYTVASVRSGPWAVGAVALGTIAQNASGSQLGLGIAVAVVFFALAAIAGSSMQATRRLVGELQHQASVLTETRGERLKLALQDERSRLARDLHDVVAHSVTAMVVQAGAARVVARSDPSQSGQILLGVEELGDEALRELRSLSEPEGAHPDTWPSETVGLDAVRSLIDQQRGAGFLGVNLDVQGEPLSCGSAVEISVYRIVQEALTNVRKYAAGANATVVLRYLTEGVEVEITNEAPTHATGTSPVLGFGRGLIGIRERAVLFGGEATAGPLPDGGFQVTARLPLQPVAE